MAQAATVKEYNFYVKGLITEASPLTFPENASLDEDNFDLLRDGSRRRRLGVDYEQDYVITDIELDAAVFSTQTVKSGLWINVDNDPLVSIFVVQVGTRIWFFDAFADAISAAPLNGGNPVELSGSSGVNFQGTSIFGKMVIVNGQRGFFVLTYDKDTDTVTINSRLLLVRDIWGIEDGLAVNQRPNTLGGRHEYNLLNQGWGSDNRDDARSYYKLFRDGAGAFPSNSDIVWTGKGPSNDIFDYGVLQRYFAGSTPSGKGAVIIDTFRRGASRAAAFNQQAFTHTSAVTTGDPFELSKFLFSIVEDEETVDADGRLISLTSIPFFQPLENATPSLPQDLTAGGLSSIASFAGRVWFAGSTSTLIDGDRRSPNLGGYLFFSQVVDTDRKMGLCHQSGDPTSEDTPDVLDSDGGTVQIPEATAITKLLPLSNGVAAFAENGVWEITGGDAPFSATNFQVRLVTSSGAISPDSILQVEGNIFFWSKAGILALAPDNISGFLTATNITEVTIQTLYNDIDPIAKAYSRGIYDSSSRKVAWFYNDDPFIDGTTFRNKYNRVLIYDTVLQAFYTQTFGELSSSSPYVAGPFATPDYNVLSIDSQIVVGTENIIVTSQEEVIVTELVKGNGVSRIGYVVVKPDTTYGFTVGLQRDPDFRDWVSVNGIGLDAPAYMLTGYEILQDSQRNKQATYITCSFKRTETGFEDVEGSLEAKGASSCLVQSQWDFANSPASGKFSTPFQAYRLKRNYQPSGLSDLFDYGQAVITSKSKLRGRGKALSLLFRTEPGKDLHLYGWGINFTGVTHV